MSETPDYAKIRSSTLGEELDDQECGVLATIMGVRRMKDGERLVGEGDADNTLFVLVEGSLAVSNIDEGEDHIVYTMQPGECAGTRAFVDRKPRKATLRAIGDAMVYTLEPDSFESLLDRYPRVVYKVMRGLFRLTHANLMRMNKETQDLTNYITRTGARY